MRRPGAGDPQQPAERTDVVVRLLRLDELEDPHDLGSDSRAKKAAAFFRDLLLLLERLHPPTQRTQLLALVGREPVGGPFVDVGQADPLSERLERDPEVFADRLQAATRTSIQPDGLSPELRGTADVGWAWTPLSLRLDVSVFRCPRNRVNSRYPLTSRTDADQPMPMHRVPE
jgi:hypothetical protein